MNHLVKHGLLVTACSIGVGLSQSSVAADTTVPVAATATIDWSKLQLSITGVNDTVPTVTFSGQNTSLSSYASSPGQYENNSKSINNWTDPKSANADAGTTFANALASTLNFSGDANAMQSGSASSSGTRTEQFTFDGPGVLTVTVPYTISLNGETSNYCYYCYNYDHASVSGSASFNSYVDNGSSSTHSNSSFSLHNYYGTPPSQSQSGTLVFGIFASGAGNGSLNVNFDLSAHSPVSSVPEPESYAMLLAGLGLMGAMVRRRGNNRNI
ncbi:PEP-CTERM protein-sorting domain-containing protein [Nitrosospira sp. Nsp1]|nr:PEP-CTERM protein-sorting domain-containing protein [Nitrosospira sp. Nsp1]